MLTGLVCAVALGAAPPAESGLSRLATRLAQAIEQRFPALDAIVVKSEGALVFVDAPALAPGLTLEWLETESEILLPGTLETVGELLRPCGRIRIRGSNGSVSYGSFEPDPGCGPPRAGTRVRLPPAMLELRIEQGEADRELRGALRLLAEVLPARLEKTGRFRAAAAAAPAGPGEPGAVRLRLHLGRSGARLVLLGEIEATAPRPLRDVVELSEPLPPEALWRTRDAVIPSARELGALTLEEGVLAACAGGEPDEALVLTARRLLRLRFDARGEAQAETLLALNALPRATPAARIATGQVLRTAGGDICVAASQLAQGLCLRGGIREPLDGVALPLPGGGLGLGRFVPGTGELDGSLRAASGQALAGLGRHLVGSSTRGDRLLLLRPEGVLEAVSLEPGARPEVLGESGDAWCVWNDGSLALSAPSAPEQPDALRIVSAEGRTESTLAVAGSIRLLACLEASEGGRRVLVGTGGAGEPARLSLLTP